MLEKDSKRFQFSTASFVVLLISIQYCHAAPVENIYDKFINDLNSKVCITPEQIKLPSNSSLAENSELFSSSLKICQNIDTVSRMKEAQYLCSEIFDNLKVVLCPDSKDMIRPLNISYSEQVCKDIALLENVSDNDKLLIHLKDSWSCDLLCDDAFKKACQVLYWSYQAKNNFEENENINKVITGNSTQASILGSDLQKSHEPSKVQNVQKTAEMAQEQTKDTVQTSTLALSTKKINSLLEHVQEQAEKPQPNLNLNLETPTQIASKDAGANSILPRIQVNEAQNVPHNVAPKALQEDVLNNNNLPENVEADSNAGLPEIEDPHDNEGIFPHNAEPDLDSNKKHPQALIDIKLPSVPDNLQLPKIPDNIRVPKLPTNNELLPDRVNDLPPANEELPQLKPNDGLVDPHDGEELGEEESPITNPKAPEPDTTVRQTQDNKIEIAKQNKANVQTQANIKNGSPTTKAAASTTKTASSKGSTKSSTTTAEKKVVEVKSSSTGDVFSVSADGKKTTESGSPSPSPKETLSSVVPPTSEDLSPAPANIDKMEEEEGVHENPEDREPEYNGGYESAKNKAVISEKTNEEEASKVDQLIEQTGNDEFAPRSKYGPDDVPLIPIYPGQEDGHFFFYFLSMVLILMAGYLIFHNKQKIIALIVEGRHERRRRSHGAGYKKLDTK